jgi:hypothetical protein
MMSLNTNKTVPAVEPTYLQGGAADKLQVAVIYAGFFAAIGIVGTSFYKMANGIHEDED